MLNEIDIETAIARMSYRLDALERSHGAIERLAEGVQALQVDVARLAEAVKALSESERRASAVLVELQKQGVEVTKDNAVHAVWVGILASISTVAAGYALTRLIGL